MKLMTLWICALLLLALPMAFADLIIEPDSILVNGDAYAAGEMVNVSPGDEVTVRFAVSNTFTDRSLGHVGFSAGTGFVPPDDIIDDLPQEKACEGTSCEGVWVLRPGESAATEFTFTVPLDIDPAIAGFDVDLNVFYDNYYGAITDTSLVSFAVIREEVSVEIVDGTMAVEPLVCSDTEAQLSFTVINNGDFPITPEVKVYNQRAVESSLNRAGEFTSFAATPTISAERTLRELNPGDVVSVLFSLDLSDLPAGQQQLYAYIINPYFDAAAFYISDQGQTSFTKTNCLSSSTPSATSLTVLQNTATSFSVTLSDASMESGVVWSVTRAGTEIDRITGTDSYTFNQATVGSYTVRAALGEESRTWSVAVAAPAPASLGIASISIANVRAGQNANATLTITNTGANRNIENLTASLEGVNARYQARLVGTLPATLAPGTSTTALQLQLAIPTDEASGEHTIGNVIVRGTDQSGTAVSATQTISINPQSFLTIESVKVNGKAAGDLTLEEANEFDVKVKNTYTEDIKDVVVTVTILAVDSDDLEEESASFDLGDGKDDTVTLTFDLGGENVDESQYTVRVEVEGEGDDRTEHRTVQTFTVDVERENHKVIIQKATLGSSSLQCSRQTGLQVIVENIGENDEDDVEIKVKNVPLGIDLTKSDIELDKFSGSDNEYRTTFNLNFEDAVAGSHTLTVEVYRDGTLDDSEEVPVQISVCSTAGSATGSTVVQAGESEEGLTAELQRQLQARQQEEEAGQQVVRASFRDSNSYTLFLGILAVLLFVAVVMAVAVLLVKKK